MLTTASECGGVSAAMLGVWVALWLPAESRVSHLQTSPTPFNKKTSDRQGPGSHCRTSFEGAEQMLKEYEDGLNKAGSVCRVDCEEP